MLESLQEFAKNTNHPIGLLLLCLASAIEYVFPPFPGDAITVFGAVLITLHGWSLWLILLATLLGSLSGAWLDYTLGRLAREKLQKPSTQGKFLESKAAWLAERFQRHGELYIVLNRFVPGIRALFFYTAGYAGMRLSRVMLYAGISALLWNAILIALGAALGANVEELQGFVLQYSTLVWGVMGVVVLAVLLRVLLRRKP